MPRALKKILTPIDDPKRFNDNFDSISRDMADATGIISSPAKLSATAATSTALAAGSLLSLEVSVLDVYRTGKYIKDYTPVVPRVTVLIDTDNDYTYFWPSGTSISSIAEKISVNTFTATSAINPTDNEVATYFITVMNNDTSAHDIYIYTDTLYIPTPDKSINRRLTS